MVSLPLISANRSVHCFGKCYPKFGTSKFRPGIAFTICTNQYHLPKNNRENLKLISNVHGFWRNGTRFQFRLEHFVWKNRTSFSEDLLPRKFSDETIQKVQSRVPFTCRPVFLESFCEWKTNHVPEVAVNTGMERRKMRASTMVATFSVLRSSLAYLLSWQL